MGPTLVVANLVEQVVLQPLPFPDPDRLVSVWNAQPEQDRHEFPLSLAGLSSTSATGSRRSRRWRRTPARASRLSAAASRGRSPAS